MNRLGDWAIAGENRLASVIDTAIRTGRAWSPALSIPWEYHLVSLVALIVVISTALTIAPIIPLLNEEGDQIEQAPQFFISYTWQEERAVPVALNTTSTVDSDLTSATETTRSTPSPTRSTSVVVSTTVYYRCRSVSKYVRTEYKDYRCRYYGNESNVVSNTSRVATPTNDTTFAVVWGPEGEDRALHSQEVNLSVENGAIPADKRILSIDSPPEMGTYTFSITADGTTARLWRPTLEDPKDEIRIPVYEPSRVTDFREREFQRRTLPFQLLAIILLWFGGVQVVLTLLNYHRNKG